MKELDLFEKTFDDLWEIEKYNFGTTDEDGWHNFDDYTEYPFAIEEMQILANEYDKIKQQLQEHKDKENKLADWIKEEMKTLDIENKYNYDMYAEAVCSSDDDKEKKIKKNYLKNILVILDGSDE